jgi:protein kinase C substrate 80K-H
MAAFHAERAEQLRVLEDGERERHEMETRAAAAVAEAQENVTALDAAAQSLRVQLEQLEARAEEEERVEREQREKLVLEKEDALLEQLGLSQLTQRQLATLVLDLARHRISSSGDVVARVHAAREKAAAALSDEQEVAQTLKDATAMDDAASAFKLREDTRRRETKRIERRIEERRQKKEKREQEAREAAEAQAKAEAESGEMPPPAPEQANEEEEEEELVLPEEEPHPLDVLLEALTESEKFSRTETSVARDARDEVKRQLSTEEKSLETAKSVLSKNYGPDSIFLPLRDECVESAPGGAYTYKICFFGKATQDRTSLGNMKDLPVKDSEAAEEDAGEENPYRLEFTGGTKCWNGPQRSLAVDIECGALPMELYDIEEPSTCVYKAKLRAPIACDAQHREEVMAPPTEIVQAAAATAPHHIEVEVPAIL